MIGPLLLALLSLQTAEPAAADAFVDSIGVNVHAHDAYEARHAELKPKLLDLGVRYVRDGIHRKACEYAVEYHREGGIKTLFITGRRVGGAVQWKSPLDPSKVGDELAELKSLALAATEAIEGPNEYDLFHDDRDKDWPVTLRSYQHELYRRVKADPDLIHLAVIAPSLTSEEAYVKVGDLSDVLDHPCLHLYQSTRPPGTPGWGPGGYGSIHWALEKLVARQGPAARGTWSTECGYNDAISDAAQATYLPRMFAEFYRRGIVRSFKYELLGNKWGLLRNDLSERPAFGVMKNLISVLKDPGPAFAPKPLEVALDGPAHDARFLTLARRDGTWDILLWREVAVWDPNTNKDIPVAPVAVALRFPKPVASLTVRTLEDPSKPESRPSGSPRAEFTLDGRIRLLRVALP
jgi:hypothetical protein